MGRYNNNNKVVKIIGLTLTYLSPATPLAGDTVGLRRRYRRPPLPPKTPPTAAVVVAAQTSRLR